MLQNRRILVVVPARGGSKGIKFKNIQPVNGVPLVSLVGQIVKDIPFIDCTVVSTDSTRIAAVAEKSGLSVPFFRPNELSGDIIGDLDVLTHALVSIEEIEAVQFDIIVMLQPTCPMRKPEHVIETIEKLIDGNYDAVWTVSETDSKSHPLKQLTIKDGKLEYYDDAGKAIIARQQLEPVYHRNGAAYAITRDCILQKKSIKGDRSGAVIITDQLVNIDTEFDLRLCDFMMREGNDNEILDSPS